MAARRSCKHQGFAFATQGNQKIKIICDWDGKIHPKEYCEKCERYEPWRNHDTENQSKKDR